MFTRIAVTSCIAALAGLAASAQAADLDEIIYAPELPMTQPVEIGSGWYLRGDLGYSVETRGAATNYSIFTPGPTYTGAVFETHFVARQADWSGSLHAVAPNIILTELLPRQHLNYFDYTEGSFLRRPPVQAISVLASNPIANRPAPVPIRQSFQHK